MLCNSDTPIRTIAASKRLLLSSEVVIIKEAKPSDLRIRVMALGLGFRIRLKI